MIEIQLNEHSAEDVKAIQELRKMGFSDEQIQKWYNDSQEDNKKMIEMECIFKAYSETFNAPFCNHDDSTTGKCNVGDCPILKKQSEEDRLIKEIAKKIFKDIRAINCSKLPNDFLIQLLEVEDKYMGG